MKIDKKLLIALAALVVLVAMVAGIYFATRPGSGKPPDSGQISGAEESGAAKKTVTVEIVHADGSQKTLTLETDAEVLGPFLVSQGVVEDPDGDGLFTIVDGEEADYNKDQSWWGFYINGEFAMTGINDTPVQDGAVYRLEYTIG